MVIKVERYELWIDARVLFAMKVGQDLKVEFGNSCVF
jgi:hypothetical protein